MPGAAIKGIIISLSIITALGVAVLENPQIQAWLDEQRQKIIELLRTIGEELDPQSRQAAEAFAYEGRTPATDAGLRREASGSMEAAAVATGRSLSNPTSAIRRIPVRGPSDPDEAEERRRKGREYLAQRNQQMYELKQRRKADKDDGEKTPPTPTSFDAMVDASGKLKDEAMPSPPSMEAVSEHIKAEMREVERNLTQPLLVGEASSSATAWQLGSSLANPFSDEYALDRSETPKPPIPPKLALENDGIPERTLQIDDLPERTLEIDDPPEVALEIDDLPEANLTMPRPLTPLRPAAPGIRERMEAHEDLSYEEQLAIALSLSEEEARRSAEAARPIFTEDDEAQIRMAIEESLKYASRAAPADIEMPQPLVDVTPVATSVPHYQPSSRQHFEPRHQWESLFDQAYSPTREPLSMAQPAIQAEEEDELYEVTPQLTHARLATLDSQPGPSQLPATSSRTSSIPYDPVREAAAQAEQRQPATMEASFYSAASSAPSPASTRTMGHEATPQLIDVSEDVAAPLESAPRPASASSFDFHTDEDSDSDTFASISAHPSRDASRPRSEVSNIEVVDLLDDSDVDMLSEEGDGIATPDSWTEVGSRDGESEMDEDEPRSRVAAL